MQFSTSHKGKKKCKESCYWEFQQLELILQWMPKQLAASELLSEQSLLDKALKQIKIYEAEKTCEKLMLMILIEKTKLLEE